MTNDRYGRRGTTARVLMRVASSLDVLVDRPTHRPAPPPGFTTKRVLGPGSDFDTSEPRRKKRRKGEHRREERYQTGSTPFEFTGEGDHPALDRSLQSSRGGFSVEELEAERALKRGLDEPALERVDSTHDVEAREGVED